MSRMRELNPGDRLTVNNDWYRWMVQSVSGYAVLSIDLRGRIATWNEGAERMFGYLRDDVLGEDARFIFTSDDIRAEVPEAEFAGATAERCAPDERWHVKKDGTVFWASGLMMRMMDDRGQHVGFVKIVRDCTDQKRA